jgi:hypothetical protein
MRKRPKKVVVYEKYGHFFMVYEIFSVFQLIATTGIRLNGAASHAVVCHPHRAVLAISMPAFTVLWRFGHKGKSELMAQIQTIQLTAYRRWVHYSFPLSSDANAIFQLWKLSLRPRSKT